MPKKKSKDQFSHYKKWTTDEGYTFVAKPKRCFRLSKSYGTRQVR